MAVMDATGTKVFLEQDGSVSIILPNQEYNGLGVEIRDIRGITLRLSVNEVCTAHLDINGFSDYSQLKGFLPKSTNPIFYLTDEIPENEIIDLIDVVDRI